MTVQFRAFVRDIGPKGIILFNNKIVEGTSPKGCAKFNAVIYVVGSSSLLTYVFSD